MQRHPGWHVFFTTIIGAGLLSALPDLVSPALAQTNLPPEDLLKTLRKGHPRLYASDSDLPRIKQAIAQDPQVRGWYEDLQRQAQRMLDEPTAEHKLIGPRLLSQSRGALRRISTLAVLYRMDKDPRKADRARKELLTVARFPDWNPSHFLDVAEMAHAVAIGYDWLFDFLSAEDRATLRAAIVEKGLKEGLKVYQRNSWWATSHDNWNQVCNGGLTVGALAIADEEPDLAREIIDKARASIVIAMRTFAPDGGWEEGPGYWNYATSYNVYYLAALETALGTDFGLKNMPGFADAGVFRIHSTGPSGLSFNFADAGERAGTAAQMLWFAREFHRPAYATHEREMVGNRPDIFHLLWAGQMTGQSAGANGAATASGDLILPRDAMFRAANAAFFRSAWGDPNAVYVGFRGGDNQANHSHLDLGTFVLDAFGGRWAIDLGGDDYNLPAYFGKLRWTYYRLRTEGHNTLTLGRENQNLSAKAPLVAFLSTTARAYAVADLTQGYTPHLTRARRGVALLDRRQVLVQDELEALEDLDVVWNFHTRAAIETQGARATLSQGKAKLEARILSPEGARFEVIPADPPPPQAQQPDVHNLIIRAHAESRPLRIAVLLAPAGSVVTPTLEPLDAWIAAGKLGQ